MTVLVFRGSVYITVPSTVFSGLQVAPEYKPHPLFLPKIWEKFIDNSHPSISRTLSVISLHVGTSSDAYT